MATIFEWKQRIPRAVYLDDEVHIRLDPAPPSTTWTVWDDMISGNNATTGTTFFYTNDITVTDGGGAVDPPGWIEVPPLRRHPRLAGALDRLLRRRERQEAGEQ
jgi:hypothetical protein